MPELQIAVPAQGGKFGEAASAQSPFPVEIKTCFPLFPAIGERECSATDRADTHFPIAVVPSFIDDPDSSVDFVQMPAEAMIRHPVACKLDGFPPEKVSRVGKPKGDLLSLVEGENDSSTSLEADDFDREQRKRFG